MVVLASSGPYLNDYAIKSIKNEIGNIFGEDTVKIVTINIEKLNKELNNSINKLETYKKNQGGFKSLKNNSERKRLMAQAYLIIFKIREFLTGEKINYRYYYQTNDGHAGVVEFEEDEILKYIKFGDTHIRIANAILSKQESNQKYQSLLDEHYNNLYKGLQDDTESNYKVVHSYIFDKYAQMNAGLRNDNNPDQYQRFNMGHFFEAVDISFTEAINENKINDYNFIERSVFGKYLYYDSVHGTKGGDNALTLTQIKANEADVLAYNTIIDDLKELRSLFNINAINKEEIKERIKNLYIHESKYEDIKLFEQTAENAADKLINILKGSK